VPPPAMVVGKNSRLWWGDGSFVEAHDNKAVAVVARPRQVPVLGRGKDIRKHDEESRTDIR
jgi:hypothetical protein